MAEIDLDIFQEDKFISMKTEKRILYKRANDSVQLLQWNEDNLQGRHISEKYNKLCNTTNKHR